MSKPMKQPIYGITHDFAITDTDHGFVVVEANEWYESVGQHRAVTLLLHPSEARMLASQLNRSAYEAEGRTKKKDVN